MTSSMTDDNPKHPPPWLFGITGIPYGVGGSFAAVTMPFFARKAHFTMSDIGWYGSALLVPADRAVHVCARSSTSGPSASSGSSSSPCSAPSATAPRVMMPLPSRMTAFLVLAFLGQTISGLSGSCNGGLMATTMPDGLRGAAGGWLNVGNLAGGAVERRAHAQDGRALPAAHRRARARPLHVAAVPGADLGRRATSARGATRGEVFRALWRDVSHVVKMRQGWTGMLLFSSPVGTAALINYFAGMAADYRASAGMVAFINGRVSGLVTAVGSLIGGYLCDRYSRRAMYLLSGGLTALCAAVMMAAPLSPMTYAIGAACTCSSPASATRPSRRRCSRPSARAAPRRRRSTRCSCRAATCAISYVGLVDTRFDKGYGPRGLLGVDAALNVVGIIALYFLFRCVRRLQANRARRRAA